MKPKKSLSVVTDKIHDLLNSPEADNGAFRQKPEQGTVRMCFEMPKAWVLLGAFVMMSKRDDAGELVVPPLEFLMDEDGEFFASTKRAAKAFYEREIYYNGHETLHEVCHMMHPPFAKPEPQEPEEARIIDDEEIPF